MFCGDFSVKLLVDFNWIRNFRGHLLRQHAGAMEVTNLAFSGSESIVLVTMITSRAKFCSTG